MPGRQSCFWSASKKCQRGIENFLRGWVIAPLPPVSYATGVEKASTEGSSQQRLYFMGTRAPNPPIMFPLRSRLRPMGVSFLWLNSRRSLHWATTGLGHIRSVCLFHSDCARPASSSRTEKQSPQQATATLPESNRPIGLSTCQPDATYMSAYQIQETSEAST